MEYSKYKLLTKEEKIDYNNKLRENKKLLESYKKEQYFTSYIPTQLYSTKSLYKQWIQN